MFKRALFVTAQYWKQPKAGSPSTGKWINKPQCVLTMEYGSVIKRRQLLICTTWMELKNMMLSERNQA